MDDRRNSRFDETDFGGSRFHGVDFTNVKISDAWLVDVDISGHVAGVSVNGVDVTEYVERVLDERHPERRLLAPTDPDGVRTAWSTVEEFAAATLARARRLAPDRLDQSVDGEWSFIETQRHLVYAIDRWLSGPVFGVPVPFHRLGMPNAPHDEVPSGVFDLDARPTLDEVIAVRRARMDSVGAFVATITAGDLEAEVASPNGGTVSVLRCLQVVFREEWWHDQYANRDLTVLEARSSAS